MNLVSDQMGVAPVRDTQLVNPWGLTRGTGTPWWVANNGSGTSTLYSGKGEPEPATPLVVIIPPASGSGSGVPTGAVRNGTKVFELTPGNPARFLFATEDGTISGWNPAVDATHAVIKFPAPGASPTGAVYKGAAIASRGGKWFLYVTNFSKGRIDVFDSSFHKMPLGDDASSLTDHEGEDDGGHRFRDRRIPPDFSPFGIQNIGGDLYVTFAKRDPATNDDVKGPGFGYVDVFNPGGRLLRRLQHGAWLNAPWGLALAPSDFGAFSHNLLVGQFGSGEIAAYDAANGRFLGKVLDKATDKVLAIDGLWALGFGDGGVAGPANTLFFTAGSNDEADGLFGTLTADPDEQLLGSGK